MANLRANKITSTEVFETTGSVQFDGDGDELVIPTSSDFDLGSGAFTIEAFVYLNSSKDQDFIGKNADAASKSGYEAGFLSTGAGVFYSGNGTSYNATTLGLTSPTGTFATSEWFHIAVVRNGNTLTMYKNGVSVASNVSFSHTITSNSVNLQVGNDGVSTGTSWHLNGYISNARVIKGKALYTKNFTPPTRELTVIPNTILLACQSTTNAAQEATGKTITVNGNAVANELTPGLLTDVVKSGGTSAITGSVEFGESDYLTLASSSDFNLGTGDFTIEFWIQPQKRFTSFPTIFEIDATNAANRLLINFRNTSTLGLTSGTTVFATNAGFNLDSWFHVAVVRQSGVSRIYKNGISGGDTACTEDFSNSGSSNIFIGWDSTITSSEKYNGFISNLRVIKGTALYTQNFIPPTAELKNIPGTVLLCCQDNESVTTEVTGKTITANGDPTGSNFTPQVGSDGSVEFAGPTKINSENYFYLPTGNTEDRGRGRGLIVGGSNTNSIEYINISTQGNSQDFGDLSAETSYVAALASSTRGIFSRSRTPSTPGGDNTIEYATIASTGNSINFGDRTEAVYEVGTSSNNTRGIIAGGYGPSNSNVMDYVTIASTGDAIDFGDLTQNRRGLNGFASPTRGCFAAGYQQPDTTTETNIIDYITVSSTGNAQDFGDLIAAVWGPASLASPTRGIWSGGIDPNATNVINYVTISSTGNAQDFGDLTVSKGRNTGMSNSIRGVIGLGDLNTMDYVTIASTGNAQDFGDMIVAISGVRGGCSDSHGGLG